MKYAVILAGGIGKRMSSTVPKQFLLLGNEPIIIRTIRKVVESNLFDSLVIAIHPEWKSYLENLLEQSGVSGCPVLLTEGGKERLDSIRNTVAFIEETYDHCSAEDDVVIFDAVRPFVTRKIMEDSLDALQHCQAVVAALPVVDTMLWIEEGSSYVTDMPRRQCLYHGQAPDSFKLVVLKEALANLTPEEEKVITGTAQICMLKGIPIHTIPGDPQNIKVTTPHDIRMADVLCEINE